MHTPALSNHCKGPQFDSRGSDEELEQEAEEMETESHNTNATRTVETISTKPKFAHRRWKNRAVWQEGLDKEPKQTKKLKPKPEKRVEPEASSATGSTSDIGSMNWIPNRNRQAGMHSQSSLFEFSSEWEDSSDSESSLSPSSVSSIYSGSISPRAQAQARIARDFDEPTTNPTIPWSSAPLVVISSPSTPTPTSSDSDSDLHSPCSPFTTPYPSTLPQTRQASPTSRSLYPVETDERNHKSMKQLEQQMEKEKVEEAAKLRLLIARLEGEREKREEAGPSCARSLSSRGHCY
ncbi:hypothetical protein BDP27DRAFT_1335764 [Rhodocollybia butyracea]|uniref:Uncharacterized protein n=1 Tax=Rhodocollybia butyracea TaxID=206335 RepID=A0A9P5PH44_9AGAR|nr:hypothetical protein BDP27DRAFT_1335764 [Rhodocollybia butyracea]